MNLPSGLHVPPGLSPRERQVMDGLIQGMRVTEIAKAYGLAQTTVSEYRKRVLARLGLKTNADLVRYVYEQKGPELA